VAEVTGDYSYTVEYVESRRDKLRGRTLFEGRLVTGASDDDSERRDAKAQEKDDEIARLDELLRKFDIDRV